MELLIEKQDHLGKGIGYYKGKIVFVPFCIPNDLVEVQIVKETKNFIEAKLVKIIKPSINRVEPLCKYFNICGGCQLLNTSYDNTIIYKKDRIKDILNGIYDGNIEFIKNDNNLYYRNKIELKVKNNKIGFYKNKTNDIVEIDNCLITRKCINNFIPVLKTFNISNGDITIRCNYNNEILISIYSKDKLTINEDILPDYKVVGIVLNDKCIYGEDKFLDKINNLFFEVSYNSFFQINSFINEQLFKIIKENVSGNVLDLYCGVGTLSLVSAQKANKVYGIEIVPNAVINAIKNAKINNIKNIDFILGKVEDKLSFIKDKINTVIVDPPRTGLDNKTIDFIKNNNYEKIIYISCETQKLKSDLLKLKDIYQIKKVYVLDMFSYTYHCESVTVLERR